MRTTPGRRVETSPGRRVATPQGRRAWVTRSVALDGVVPYPPEVATRYRDAGYWIGQTHDDLLRAAAADAPDQIAVIGRDPAVRPAAPATGASMPSMVAPGRTEGGAGPVGVPGRADGGIGPTEIAWTYAELDARVERLAAGLAALGLGRGERVVVQLPNVPEFVRVVFALWRVGALPVFALPAHRRAEIDYFVRFTGAAGLITCGLHDGFDHAGLARALRQEVPSLRIVLSTDPGVEHRPWLPTPTDVESADPAPRGAAHPSDVAFLQLSGGTTGTPKLIPRTHDDYLYSVRESARICGLDAESVMLLALPAAHNFSMSSPGLLGMIYARGTTVLTTDPSPASFYRLVARHRVSIAPAVPPLALAWLNSPERAGADVSSLRVLQVGGARLSDSVAARVGPELGCTLQQVFGMAEGLVNYTRLCDDDATIIGTQGLRISGADEVRVVDDADRQVAPGEPGHLLTRGPYTIRGYYRAPEHNARAFTADGFYRTGDLVVERADGYLTVVGRAKDQINRGGEKIAPQEIEDHLLAHPDVHDVSVVGVADDHLGERALAHVVLREAAGRVRPVDLRRHLQRRGLAAYKVPDEFAFGSALPQTGVGKVDRRHLRDDPGEEVYDIVGVGFGPANLALAIAVEEHNEACPRGQRLRLLCCEKRGGSQWHPGMLLPDASMQVSFLKDLVTFRNPCSPYTFVNFLRSVGRLVEFTNRGASAPLRIEFAAYLRWVAERLDHYASLGTEVLAITPVGRPTGRDGSGSSGVDAAESGARGSGLSGAGLSGSGLSGAGSRGSTTGSASGGIEHFDVTVRRRGRVTLLRARNVVVAAGLQPRMPTLTPHGAQDSAVTRRLEPLTDGPRVWHSNDYLHRAGELAERADRAGDLVVLGSGQSAIEVALDAYERMPDARVHLVSSQYGIGPSEQGPLVNEIFDPESVDALYAAPAHVRDRLDALHRGANHGTANPREIDAFYDRRYRDRWLGVDRLRLHRASRVTSVVDDPAARTVRVDVVDDLTGAVSTIDADALICATGYRPFDVSGLLGEHAELLVRDAHGRPLVERDCRALLETDAPAANATGPADAELGRHADAEPTSADRSSAGLYLVGQSEHQHGFSTSLLSTLAVRAGDILDSICQHRTGGRPPDEGHRSGPEPTGAATITLTQPGDSAGDAATARSAPRASLDSPSSQRAQPPAASPQHALTTGVAR